MRACRDLNPHLHVSSMVRFPVTLQAHVKPIVAIYGYLCYNAYGASDGSRTRMIGLPLTQGQSPPIPSRGAFADYATLANERNAEEPSRELDASAFSYVIISATFPSSNACSKLTLAAMALCQDARFASFQPGFLGNCRRTSIASSSPSIMV